MSLYVCENCKCVENTALGQYWSKDSDIYPEPYNGKALCSECSSPKFIDGSLTGFGKWHNRFEKMHVKDWNKKHPDSKIKY